MQLDLTKVQGNDGHNTGMSRDSNLVSILDLELEDDTQSVNIGAKLNSPRTLEAMASLGLEPTELESVPYESVREYYVKRERTANINFQLVDLRWKTLNKRRFDKRDLIIFERQKIIEQENMLYGGQVTNLSQNSQLMGNSSIANPMFADKDNAQMYQTQGNQATKGSHISQNGFQQSNGGQSFRQTTSAFPKFVQSSTSNFMRSSVYSTRGGTSKNGQGVTSRQSGSIGAAANKSSMLEQEMKAIRKIKEKQRKEVEQLIDQQLRMQQIKEKNEQNQLKQVEKDKRHAAEVEESRRQQELRKQEDELHRKEKQEVEQEAIRKRTEEMNRREQEARRKMEQNEIQRQYELKMKEEERKQKMVELQIENEKKQAEQEQAMKIRREELDRRELQRVEFREAQQKAQTHKSLMKRMAKETKIKLAKDQAEATIQQQRQMFAEKEFQSQVKRQQFEHLREEQKKQTAKQSAMKAQQMKQIFEDSQRIEQMKKDKMLQAFAEAAKRQRLLQEQQDKEIVKKKILSKQKQEYQQNIQVQNKEMEQQKIQTLISSRQSKEKKQEQTQKQKDFENTFNKEMQMLAREERLQNVERIAKANKYALSKIQQKIEFDKQRGDQIMDEKKSMLETRFAVRRQAEQQKRAMLETVERMKKKGNFSKEDLAELGFADQNPLDIDPVPEDENEDQPPIEVEELQTDEQQQNPEEIQPETKAQEAFITQVDPQPQVKIDDQKIDKTPQTDNKKFSVQAN